MFRWAVNKPQSEENEMNGHCKSWLFLAIFAAVIVPIIVLLSPAARAAGPWYVAPLGDDGHSCLNALNPCATINGAIAKASPGDTIYVAVGTYTASTGDEVVLVDRSITISGGWNSDFTAQIGMSTIDGQKTRRGITISSNLTAVIDYLHIQNGYSVPTPTNGYKGRGGGLLNAGNLTLNNLVLYNNVAQGNSAVGDGGGGIYNTGVLTINDSLISENVTNCHGGGIYNSYELNALTVINRSSITNNKADGGGGGISTVNNDVIIHDSLVSKNRARGGGGIYARGPVTLNNSTVSGNKAIHHGGGILLESSVILNNATVTLNTTDGYGGGYYDSNEYLSMVSQNSIIAGNNARNGPDCFGSISSLGYNLIENTSSCALTMNNGDLTGINADLGLLVGNPGYHPLLSGSPAIDAGNPAGCQGSNGSLLTDQRGANRVGRCDIGAYEYTDSGAAAILFVVAGSPQHAPPNTDFKTSFQVAVLDSLGSPVSYASVLFSAPASGASGIFADSGTHLTTALTAEDGIATASTFTANEISGEYTITVTVSGIDSPGNLALGNIVWYVKPDGDNSNSCLTPDNACLTINGALDKADPNDTIYVASGPYFAVNGEEVVRIDKDITLTGGWDNGFTTESSMSIIDGEEMRRGLSVESLAEVELAHFIIQSGYYLDNPSGGGIFNGGFLSLRYVQLLNNFALYGGGLNNDGILTLYDGLIQGNEARQGGGVQNSGFLFIHNSSISNNVATVSSGGGINNHGFLLLNNSAIHGNSTIGIRADGPNGGGLFTGNYNAIATLNNSTVSDNHSTYYGGGIAGKDFTLNNCTISHNHAAYNGGGIFSDNNTVLRNSIIAENTAVSDCQNVQGSVNSSGYNLVGYVTDCGFTPDNTDILSNVPLLGLLQGSPAYHPLFESSLAVDAGNPSGCMGSEGLLTTDQRGVLRVGRCDIGAYEYDPANDPLSHIFMPLVAKPKPPRGLYGVVKENGIPAASIPLSLRFYNGSAWSTIATTTTAADGAYSFINMPALAPGQRYYVRYQNTTDGDPNRLWAWWTQEVTAYVPGSEFNIGNFDLANIELTSPSAGATINLPYTFHWTPRPASTTDSYEFNLFDYDDNDPYFYTDPPLGYVGAFTLLSLPPGFAPGVYYVWDIWVYCPDGGYGISYWSYYVRFSTTGMISAETEPAVFLRQNPPVEDRQVK